MVKCQCKGCKKRLTLVEATIQCKCGKVFCSKHRLCENHNCSIDHKDKDVDRLIKNMECVPAKLITI